MKEDQVIKIFKQWLESQQWTIVPPTDRWTDLEAVRGSERIVCEAKGKTSDAGLDCDTGYGQLLRRMTDSGLEVRYALVVPSSALHAALRVPERVRELLRVTVFEVAEDGSVAHH